MTGFGRNIGEELRLGGLLRGTTAIKEAPPLASLAISEEACSCGGQEHCERCRGMGSIPVIIDGQGVREHIIPDELPTPDSEATPQDWRTMSPEEVEEDLERFEEAEKADKLKSIVGY